MTIRALLSAADGSDHEVDLHRWRGEPVRDDQLLWIDVTGDEEEDLQLISAALRIDQSAAEAMRERLRLPGASVLRGGVQLTLLWLDTDELDEPVPIQVLAGEGWVISR